MKPIILLLTALLAIVVYTGVDAQSDTTAPVVVEVTLDPAFVDTAAGPQTITVTARITDDLSGFSGASMYFEPQIGTTQSASVHFSQDNQIEGTALEGLYRSTMALPRYAAWGRWIITQMSTYDQVGNSASRGHCCVASEMLPWYFVNQRDSLAYSLYMPHIEFCPWPFICR